MPKTLPVESIKQARQAAFAAWDKGIRTKNSLQQAMVEATGISKGAAWRLLTKGDPHSPVEFPPVWGEIQERARAQRTAVEAVRDAKAVEQAKKTILGIANSLIELLGRKVDFLKKAMDEEPPPDTPDPIRWKLGVMRELKLTPSQLREVVNLMSDLTGTQTVGDSNDGGTAQQPLFMLVGDDMSVEAQVVRTALQSEDPNRRGIVLDMMRAKVKKQEPESPMDLGQEIPISDA